MEAKELKITIPENYDIDWQESAKQEKIVFKKKNTKPRSWEEYCKLQKENLKYGYVIDDADTYIDKVGWKSLNTQNTSSWRNVLPSKELAEAFLAMMQLMSLRQAWIGDWEPDWNMGNYCVSATNSDIYASALVNFTHPLSFPTQEMATDFMNTFRDLLEIAKPLI